jgi:Tfp pilus assembly protein PilO
LNKKRYLLLGLICICTVYLFETYFLTPEAQNYREALEDEYKTLQRYENVVKGAGATEADIKKLAADMKNVEKRLIREKSDFLASAKIQGEITDLADKTGLNLATIRPMNAAKVKAYSVVQVYFEGSGNINQLSEFLKLVEANPLLLKIDKLSFNITNMQNPDDLKFKIQISGLRKI